VASAWRSPIVWAPAALVAAAVLLSFVMWGVNGPAYLVDLVAAYCL
jgi:hypothetical protein